jgi:hypothetical protein
LPISFSHDLTWYKQEDYFGGLSKAGLLEFGDTSNCSPILPFTPSNHIFKSIIELSILPLRVGIVA